MCGPAALSGGIVANEDASRGYATIAGLREREVIEHGAAVTQFLRFGGTVRIEILDEKGRSLCGAIEQKVARLER